MITPKKLYCVFPKEAVIERNTIVYTKSNTLHFQVSVRVCEFVCVGSKVVQLILQ